MGSPLLIPMFIHVIWAAILYALLTILRAPKVWGIALGKIGGHQIEAVEGRVSANLSNQFEWPIFFYVICVIIMLNPASYITLYTWLSWIFILGRFLHSGVQIITNHVRLRGLVFTINFLSVLGMWLTFMVRAEPY